MSDEAPGEQRWPARCAGEPYAYLTTIGRRTGRPHRIEIWFAVRDRLVYLLAGGRERSDWVRNLQANAHVMVELGDETHAGTARVLQAGTVEDQRARALLVGKYREGDNLDEWGRTALPVEIEFYEHGVGSVIVAASGQTASCPRGTFEDSRACEGVAITDATYKYVRWVLI